MPIVECDCRQCLTRCHRNLVSMEQYLRLRSESPWYFDERARSLGNVPPPADPNKEAVW